MFIKRWKLLRFLGTISAMILVAPLIVACSKPVPVSIHGVNYTVEPFSYVLTDPNDPKNTGGGELIESYAAGGTMCCYELPRIWQPGMKVSVRLAHWEGKLADDSLRQVVSTQLVEVPRFPDGKPGELWVLRTADGSTDLVLSDFQPNHAHWPGKVKGWPVPSVAYRRHRWDLYIHHEKAGVELFKELLTELKESPSVRAKEAWDFAVENNSKSLKGFSGPEDSGFQAALLREYQEGLRSSEAELARLEKGRP